MFDDHWLWCISIPTDLRKLTRVSSSNPNTRTRIFTLLYLQPTNRNFAIAMSTNFMCWNCSISFSIVVRARGRWWNVGYFEPEKGPIIASLKGHKQWSWFRALRPMSGKMARMSKRPSTPMHAGFVRHLPGARFAMAAVWGKNATRKQVQTQTQNNTTHM